MADPKQLEELKTLATSVKGMSADTLAENQRWGAMNFRDVMTDMRQIIAFGTHLSELPVALIPVSPMNPILDAMRTGASALERMTNFDLEKSANPRDERDAIAANVRAAAEQLLLAAQSWIPFLAYQRGDVQKNINDLGAAVMTAAKMLETAQATAALKKTELDSIITAAREASATVGVGHFTSDFAGEATRLERVARDWLRVTAALGAVTLTAALALAAWGVPADASSAHVANFLTSKIVVLVILLSATLWCGRIYKATKHQEAMNHHRANALKTFQAFVKAAASDSTRDAVLLETTRSIFAISPSGYLDTADQSTEPASKLMEIIRAPSRAAS